VEVGRSLPAAPSRVVEGFGEPIEYDAIHEDRGTWVRVCAGGFVGCERSECRALAERFGQACSLAGVEMVVGRVANQHGAGDLVDDVLERVGAGAIEELVGRVDAEGPESLFDLPAQRHVGFHATGDRFVERFRVLSKPPVECPISDIVTLKNTFPVISPPLPCERSR
jgi:hypothetical protein